MVSTFTPNIQLEIPARGDDVGTWDTPVGSDFALLDLIAGGNTAVSLNNSPVVLSAAQFKNKEITFNSTLTGNVAITFPTSFIKSYEVFNNCTGIGSFVITLQTTATGGQVVALPPGEIVDVINDGANIKFKNLGRIGSYMDIATSATPGWISGCTIPPYLNCDGTAFSSATYPVLATILGGTTLPDSKGRTRFALDQGAARLSSAAFSAGFNPNAVGNAGGSQNVQGHSHAVFVTDPGHTHTSNAAANTGGSGTGGGGFPLNSPIAATINNAFTGITAVTSAFGLGNSGNVPPAYIGGITMIRAG